MPPDYARLTRLVQLNDEAGIRELYGIFNQGMRYYLARQLGPGHVDDHLHDVFLTVVAAIQRGDVREPERLMGYARTIVRRHIAGAIETIVTRRRTQIEIDAWREEPWPLPDHGWNPEELAVQTEQREILTAILGGVTKRDREVLQRFYYAEESAESIARAMHITDTQFRLLKSRAKARVGELGKRYLARRGKAFAVSAN